ncbi:MAG: hypothetical protein U5Q16_12480 [Gammaproteobacteria bacterium]|nr:hypothetical protein [Gammaproteobacteria bacterium]
MHCTHGAGFALVLACLLGAGAQAADAVPAGCRAALTPDSLDWVEARLDLAAAALEGGDADAAEQALYEAQALFPRSADVSVSPRCLGPAPYRRLFELRRDLASVRADAALAAADRFRGRNSALHWLVQGRLAARLETLLDDLPDEPALVNHVFGVLEQQLADTSAAGVGGDLPPYDFEEAGRWRDSVRAVQSSLLARAGERTADLLAEEARAWEAPPSEMERQGAAGLAQADELLSAVMGEGAADEPLLRGERPVVFYRAPRSRQILGRALGFAGQDGETRAVEERIESRAEALLELARDPAVNLAVRDGLYGYAAGFYDLIGLRGASETIQAERAGLQGELEAAREAHQARMTARADKLREALPSETEMREAADKLLKSDAERAEFEAEADEMEAELGFD